LAFYPDEAWFRLLCVHSLWRIGQHNRKNNSSLGIHMCTEGTIH
jgi:hypothetical protein